MPIATFLESYDLSGKTIIPFCSHGGGRFGQSLTAHYKTLVRYINFEDMGMVLGYGCGSPSMTMTSGFPEKAYQLAKNI